MRNKMEKFQAKNIVKEVEKKYNNLLSDYNKLSESMSKLINNNKMFAISLTTIERFLEEKYGKWDEKIRYEVIDLYNKSDKRVKLINELKNNSDIEYIKKSTDELKTISKSLNMLENDSVTLLALYLKTKRYDDFNEHIKWMEDNKVDLGNIDPKLVLLYKQIKNRYEEIINEENIRNESNKIIQTK